MRKGAVGWPAGRVEDVGSRRLRWIAVGLLAAGAYACTGTISGGDGNDARSGVSGVHGAHGSSSSGDGSSDGSGDGNANGSNGNANDSDGNANGGSDPGGADAPGGAMDPATSGWPAFGEPTAFQLRRLTTEQYVASVKTLLGVSTDGMPGIEKVSPAGGFSAIGATSASVSSAGVGQFEDAARFLAAAVFAPGGPRDRVVPCTPTGVGDSKCFEAFVRSFGPKVFRRPLSADEITRYTTLTSDLAATTNDAEQALEGTLGAFLQSPNFLYLAEVGESDPDNADRYRFSDYEMAARLSYFLTNDVPDDQLTAAAASGALLTSDGIATEVARLLALPGARESVRSFFASLLSLDNLDTLHRPVEVFPAFTDTLGPAMKQETLLGIEDLVFERDGDYRSLFDSHETFVNAELAALYGVDAPSGDGFARVTLPESTGRAGLLSQAGVLAARDHGDQTSPTRRGLFILTRLLCQDLPLMPPANLTIPPPPTGNLTARQRLEEHAQNAVCNACHRTMDPVGLSLEHFDAMGAYRETDHGMTIDDTGMIDGQSYQGVVGLGAMLRDHPALGPCLIQSLYGVAVGHLATDFDRATFAALVDDFDMNDGRVRALLTAIATSDGFRYLPVPDGN